MVNYRANGVNVVVAVVVLLQHIFRERKATGTFDYFATMYGRPLGRQSWIRPSEWVGLGVDDNHRVQVDYRHLHRVTVYDDVVSGGISDIYSGNKLY